MSTATAQTAPGIGVERAGSQALSVFAYALNARVLQAHADGPVSLGELESTLGWAAKASLRAATAQLCGLDALKREGRRPIVTKLTPAGRDLLSLANTLERWFSHSPYGALDFDHGAARGIVRALVAGWDSTIVQALAEGPCRLAELRWEVDDHSYPALKRRFVNLRTASLLTPIDEEARSPTYEATPFLRHVVGPLGLAVQWERDHAYEAPSLAPRDLTALLLLCLPLAELPSSASGSCVFATPSEPLPSNGGTSSPTTISLVVEKGRVVSLAKNASSRPATWALGSSDAWLDVLLDCQIRRLRLHGPDAKFAWGVLVSASEAILQAAGSSSKRE